MQHSSAPSARASRRPEPLLLLVVLAVTLAAYSPALSFQFTYDDFPQIVHNELVHSWHAGLFFKIHVWAQTSAWGNYYRPLFLYLLLLEHTAFKLDPMGWHAVSIALHLVVVLLVFALAREFLDEQSALVSAMIFALHPVHVESVVWVSGVTDPMLAVFTLPCILFYIRFRKRGQSRYLLLALLFYTGALLSKETAIIIPGLIAAWELFCAEQAGNEAAFANRGWQRFSPLLLFVLATVGYCAVRYRVLGTFSRTVTPLDWHIIAYTWPSVLLEYLRLLVIPYPLCLFYDVPYVIHPGWVNFWLPCLLLLVIAGVLGWLALRWGPPAKFAVTLLVLPVLPALNFSLLPLNEVVHDRYLYLPSIGLALLAGLAWQQIRTITEQNQQERHPIPWKAPLLVCLAFVLAVLTAVQSLPWVNNLVLYAETVKRAPNLPVVHNNMGNELTDRGMYDDAIQQYQIALKILPNYWFSLFNLGAAYYKSGRYEEAAPMFDRALHINGQDAESWYYAGLTQQKLGHIADAERDLRIAVQLWPSSEEYRQALVEVQRQKNANEGLRP